MGPYWTPCDAMYLSGTCTQIWGRESCTGNTAMYPECEIENEHKYGTFNGSCGNQTALLMSTTKAHELTQMTKQGIKKNTLGKQNSG